MKEPSLTIFNPRALFHGDSFMENYAQWIKESMEQLVSGGGRKFTGCGGECVEIKNCLIVKEKLQKANCKSEKVKNRIWKKVGSLVSSLSFLSDPV